MKYQAGDRVKLLSEIVLDDIIIPVGTKGTINEVLSILGGYKVDFPQRHGVVVPETKLEGGDTGPL